MINKNRGNATSKKSTAPDSQSIFILLSRCDQYHISYGLMCELDYFDLLYLVQEHEIQQQLMILSMNRNRSDNEVIDMTPEKTSAFFTSGIKTKKG